MIRFGPWSIFLLVFAGQALVLAAALAREPRNRTANRYLALLLIVMAGMLTPYILGYAGFYDAYRWLSFAPFAIPLAIGPLAYAHVLALTRGAKLPRWHWALPAAQFAYQAILFTQSIATKTWFDGAVHEPWIQPMLDVTVPVSLIAYFVAGTRGAIAYRHWLAARRRDTGPAARLIAPLGVLLAIAVARTGFELWNRLVAPTDYFDHFGFYVLLALATAWLGIEGLRRAATPAPAETPAASRDWTAIGQDYVEQIALEQWWRDPDLDVDRLARLLATNGTSLSRAINAAGTSLPDLLARLRAEAVALRLREGDDGDLLGIAFDAGFGSKASFNRAFRARFGMTPSAYRLAHGSNRTSSPPQAELKLA